MPPDLENNYASADDIKSMYDVLRTVRPSKNQLVRNHLSGLQCIWEARGQEEEKDVRDQVVSKPHRLQAIHEGRVTLGEAYKLYGLALHKQFNQVAFGRVALTILDRVCASVDRDLYDGLLADLNELFRDLFTFPAWRRYKHWNNRDARRVFCEQIEHVLNESDVAFNFVHIGRMNLWSDTNRMFLHECVENNRVYKVDSFNPLENLYVEDELDVLDWIDVFSVAWS